MAEIKWQDPPESKLGRPSKWVEIGAQLRKRPSKWALVHHGSPTVATNIKTGRLRLGPGVFEATSRKAEDGRHDIYARCVEAES